jgi:hypothetical protein
MPTCECVPAVEVDEPLLPALTTVPALLALPPRPVVIVVWCTLDAAAT